MSSSVHGHDAGAPATQQGPVEEKIDNDGAPLLKTYRRRWWVLLVFCLLAILEGLSFNIPGGLSSTWTGLYGLSNWDIQMLFLESNLSFFVAVPLASFVLSTPNGLRLNILAGLALTLLGAVLRLLATNGSGASIALLHASNIANAFAGPPAMGSVSTLAEAWFPANERGVATAIGAEIVLFGQALAMVVGPLMTPERTWAQLEAFNFMMAGLVALPLIAAVIYFPSHPPIPPSHSALVHKVERVTCATFASTVKLLFSLKNFLVMGLAYGLSSGMNSSWGGTVVLILQNQGVDPTTAGWVALFAIAGGLLVGPILGFAVDRLRNHKAVIVVALSLSFLCFTWFTVLVSGALPSVSVAATSGLVQVFIAAGLAGTLANAAVPIIFEQAVECSYPVPEGTVVMACTGLNGIFSAVLLFIPINDALSAFNGAVTASIALSAIAVALFFVESSKRFDVDRGAAAAETALEIEGEEAQIAGGGAAADGKTAPLEAAGEVESGSESESVSSNLLSPTNQASPQPNGGVAPQNWSSAVRVDGLLSSLPGFQSLRQNSERALNVVRIRRGSSKVDILRSPSGMNLLARMPSSSALRRTPSTFAVNA